MDTSRQERKNNRLWMDHTARSRHHDLQFSKVHTATVEKYSKPTQFRMKLSQIRKPVMLFLLVNLGRVSVRDKITYFGRNCAEFLTTLLATHDSGALVATPSQLISHRAFPHWRCRKRIPRHLPTNRKNVLISHSHRPERGNSPFSLSRVHDKAQKKQSDKFNCTQGSN